MYIHQFSVDIEWMMADKDWWWEAERHTKSKECMQSTRFIIIIIIIIIAVSLFYF